jgi:release factor glutamine methyltransferase
MPTIAEALRCAERALAPIADEQARIEAETLLASTLGIDRAHLLARTSDELIQPQAATLDAHVRRRLSREPLSYIVGSCEFFGVEIVCTPAALIPRPETEMLVEFALDEVRERSGKVRIADIGVGSGAIAVAIAVNAPEAHIVATDASDDALGLARLNVDRNGVGDRVRLVHGDLLDGLEQFDVIVANLPYVSERDWPALAPEIRDHEPRTALIGGATGLEIIERLLWEAAAHLAPGGTLAAEIGDAQGAAALSIARACFPAADVYVMKDLAGLDRMLVVRT